LGRLAGGCGVDSFGSGWGPVADCCECGDECSCSGTMELVKFVNMVILYSDLCILSTGYSRALRKYLVL
jgi:hypothetical protein